MITRTTTALLEDLRSPGNEAVWAEFDGRFRPVLVGFARRLGLDPEDAADTAQEALARFVKSYREGRYCRDRGRLHSWLLGIAHKCVLDHRRKRAASPERRGLSAIVDRTDERELGEMWRSECEREILRQAVDRLRSQSRLDQRTISAFERIAIERRTAAEVAEQLDMSMNEVYLAKHRCLKRLRSFVDELSEAFEMD